MARTFHAADWRRGRWEERRFAPTIAAHLKAEFRDNGSDTFAKVDGDLWCDGQIVAVCEIKRHYVRWGKYPEVMFERKKLEAVLLRARQHKVAGYVAVRFNNCDQIAAIDPELPYREAMGGRSDRGDPQDRQFMSYVPADQFTQMETLPFRRTAGKLNEAAITCLESIRRKRSIDGINNAAKAAEQLVWELEDCEEGWIQARAHHIRNLCQIRRKELAS